MKKQFVKQAKLPRAAYDVSFQDSVAVLTPSDRVHCPCHPANSFNKNKHRACFVCYQTNYACCEKSAQEVSI